MGTVTKTTSKLLLQHTVNKNISQIQTVALYQLNIIPNDSDNYLIITCFTLPLIPQQKMNEKDKRIKKDGFGC